MDVLMIKSVEFILEHPNYLAPNNAAGFLTEDGGKSYTLCHCESLFHCYSNVVDGSFEVWSNFEIADMDFWRGEAYTAFFNFLESRGGFYYEVRPSIRPFPLPTKKIQNPDYSAGAMHQSIA
jgi:hypothetical protein